MSGNLSFLNWLTIVPSLACFDDASLGFLFPSGGAKRAVLEIQNEEAAGLTPKPTKGVSESIPFKTLALNETLVSLFVPEREFLEERGLALGQLMENTV